MTQESSKLLKNRLFIQTLSALSPTDLKAFKVLCKQSLMISKETKKLFDFIAKAYPLFETLTEQKVFAQFFPNNPEARILLNYALHHLFELLQNWLVQKELEDDKHLQNQLCIRACKKRFLQQQFFKKTQKTLDTLESDCLAIPDTWYQLFAANRELFYHVQTDKNQEKIESLSEMGRNLELFYHGSKIKLLCQKVYRNKKLKNLSDYDRQEITLTLHFAKKNGQHIPYFSLYAQLIQYLQNPDESMLEAFIRDFKRDRTALDRLDQSLLLSFMVYSLNGATRKGNKMAMDIQFDLFKIAFEDDLLLLDNEMNAGFFNNFLIVSCTLGEFTIAKKMLKKYTPYFNSTIRDECVNLMECTLFFHQKRYDKVEVNLRQFQFKNPMFRIRSRNLFLKSLYESYQSDRTLEKLILSELIKLRKYIKKQNGISEFQKDSYYNMIAVIRKLTNTRYRRPPQRERIKQELSDFITAHSNKAMSLNWLIEKIKSL
jgi:hypothetical protein